MSSKKITDEYPDSLLIRSITWYARSLEASLLEIMKKHFHCETVFPSYEFQSEKTEEY